MLDNTIYDSFQYLKHVHILVVILTASVLFPQFFHKTWVIFIIFNAFSQYIWCILWYATANVTALLNLHNQCCLMCCLLLIVWQRVICFYKFCTIRNAAIFYAEYIYNLFNNDFDHHNFRCVNSLNKNLHLLKQVNFCPFQNRPCRNMSFSFCQRYFCVWRRSLDLEKSKTVIC